MAKKRKKEKNTVNAKTSNLPVIKLIQKALHEKLSVMCYSKWNKKTLQQILVLLTLEQRIDSRGNQIIPTSVDSLFSCL